MARFGQTKREQIAHAVESLEGVGAPLLGAVFTMLPTRGGSSYGYGYGYYGAENAERSPRHQLSADPSTPKPHTSGTETGQPPTEISDVAGEAVRRRPNQ